EEISVETLEIKLFALQKGCTQEISVNILEDMIAGIGLQSIIFSAKLNLNLSLAGRTIKYALEEEFKNKKTVSNIMTNYYRLLYIDMLISGQNELMRLSGTKQKLQNSNGIKLSNKRHFFNGCINYLCNLPYCLIENLMPFPILFRNCHGVGNAQKMCSLFSEISQNNLKFKDFKDKIYLNNDDLEMFIESSLLKCNLAVKSQEPCLIDTETKNKIKLV
ncbi:TPA: hypothetical protein ACQ0F8_001816, partial [Streptococcus agalactiae]